MGESGVSLLLCTAPVAEAAPLADRLLDEGRIACANLLGPIQSRYRWQGELEVAEEMLLLLKAPRAQTSTLRQRIEELHSYEVPEILEFQVDDGLPAYLEWVLASCGAAPPQA